MCRRGCQPLKADLNEDDKNRAQTDTVSIIPSSENSLQLVYFEYQPIMRLAEACQHCR